MIIKAAIAVTSVLVCLLMFVACSTRTLNPKAISEAEMEEGSSLGNKTPKINLFIGNNPPRTIEEIYSNNGLVLYFFSPG